MSTKTSIPAAANTAATKTPPLNPETLAIPLSSHEAIVAALHLCAMVGNDNRAVVMLKGYGEDWDDYTGIYLDDYEQEMLADPDCFECYSEPALWVSFFPAGVQ